MEKDGKTQPKRSSQNIVMVLMAIIVLVCAAGLIYTGYLHYDKQLENDAELLKNSAEQTASSLDMQFAKLEDISVALLADGEQMSFDAADHTKSKYEISRRLTELTKTITRLSLIDNYCDFTLLYRNDAAAGKLSDGTRERLCNDDGELYPVLTELLGEHRRVWVTGIDGNYDKVYYISRANDHALFFGGFYTEELRYMVASSGSMGNSRLLLTDKNNNIIMSIDNSKVKLQPDVVESGRYAYITDTKLQAGAVMENGWKVVLIKDITDTYELYKKLSLEMAVALVLTTAVIMVIYLVNFKTDPAFMGIALTAPDVDMLTGITNAEEAENVAADKLETCVSGSTFMLALVRITNLNEMEAKYGRSGYNGAIIKTYRGLAEFFGTDAPDSKNILGRMGDGEFLVMADYTQYDLFKANDALKEGLIELSEAMNSVKLAQEGDTHICIGAAVYPHNSTDYDDLYSMAEKALNEAINDDERNYAIYRKEKGTHKW